MSLFVNPIQFQNDDKGRSTPFAAYYFYENNTFVFKSTYADIDRTVPNSNPVIADGAGRFPKIYLASDEPYRVRFSELKNPNQYVPVWTEDDVTGGLDATDAVSSIDSVANIAGYTGTTDDQQISLKGWHPDSDVGGGTLYWDSAALKSTHNGGTIFSPTVPWTTTTADYLNAVGETDLSGAGVWVRLSVGFISTSFFGAKFDAIGGIGGSDGTDDTSSIQATFNAAGLEGSVIFQSGVATVTQVSIDGHLTVRGSGNGIDDSRADLIGSWLRLKDSAGLAADAPIVHIKHIDVTSATKRRFCLWERIGIFGNRVNNTEGDGLLVTAKNTVLNNFSIVECAGNGAVNEDQTGSGNDGANASLMMNPWVGYNSGHGVLLQRPTYSGDHNIIGGHIFWNDNSGVYVNQPNVTLTSVGIWWNLDGVIVDGTNAGQSFNTPGCRIYDNAAAGVRLTNSVKNISINGDIHGNGNEDRWTHFTPPKTSGDIPQNEQAGIFCDTAAINILIGDVNFGFLNDSGRQYYGLRSIDAAAEFSIGNVTSDGSTSTQWLRAISLTAPVGGVLHGAHTKSDMTHPGFISNGDINLNSSRLANVDSFSAWAWDLNTVSSGVLTATSSTEVLSEGAPVNITDIAVGAAFTGQLPIIIFRNGGANAVTFVHNTSKIRNISLANVVLAANESISYVAVSTGVYQQFAGK